jgi:arylsulfatase A-like enzyme
MIVKWPGKVKSGSESDHISAFWDVLPTVCELAGVPIPENTDGISFLPEMLGKEQKAHKSLYWEFNETTDFKKTQYKQAVRKGKWKGIYYVREDKFELYDLSEDLGETNDVSSEHPQLVKELRGIMNQAHVPSERFPLTKEELTEAGVL